MAWGDGTPGAEGLSGLARVHLCGGADQSCVEWPLDDYAASQLTVRMLHGMYGGERLSRAQALVVSMLALMDEAGNRFAHPSIRAPFF